MSFVDANVWSVSGGHQDNRQDPAGRRKSAEGLPGSRYNEKAGPFPHN